MKAATLIHIFMMLLVTLIMDSTIAFAVAEVDIASTVRGGRLYDNWSKEIKAKAPKESHNAYPSDKRYAKRPENNWLCKECHGWDYLGSEGAYGQGSHFTGIKGIRGMVDAKNDDIVTILKDKNHNYGGLLNIEGLRDLANFVSSGQVDMDAFIDRATGKAKGDRVRHKAYYDSICANCHGSDGQKMTTIRVIGETSRANPWKTLHKILNGHPHENMPALRVLGMDVVVNILAYAQTLPDKDILSSTIRGGRLYDNWLKEKNIHSKPLSNSIHPYDLKHLAYPKDGAYAKKPRANWRCKECHGWDYLGSEGAYGQGRHFTGIKGIRGMARAQNEAIISILKDENHGYDELLDLSDLNDLANFVKNGQVDMDTFIDRTTRKAKGRSNKHQKYYDTICANCHGQDGLQISTMPPLGNISRSNPWEALHKILNGHPDEKMPALRVLDYQIMVDVLSHIQTLPTER